MEDADTSSKKLTLQGFSKLKLNLEFNALASRNTCATIVKKRRRNNTHTDNTVNSDNDSNLVSLTEQEKIFRITAVQNAVCLQEKQQRASEDELVQTKFSNSSFEIQNKKEETHINTVSDKINKKFLDDSHLSNLKEEDDSDNKTINKKPKISKDIYSKHSKLVITQAIDEKDEKSDHSLLQPRVILKNRKSKSIKGANISRLVVIPDYITVRELAIRMAEDSRSVLKIFKEESNQSSHTLNDIIDSEIACRIVKKFHHTVKRISHANKEQDILLIENKEFLSKKPKPPIVTFMGHVDHGKTSLLDALRTANVADTELGGITQHISAYQISNHNNQKITFIDTPGHEAFTAMRACGAHITNIIVIVIAAGDGVMPQTIEAINHARKSNVAIIVAINKIDQVHRDNIEKIINGLPKYNLIPESLGGDIMVIPVSAKKKINLDKLEESILFISELMNLEAIEDCRALGYVIESRIDKHQGISATLIVQEGTLKIGNLLVVGTTYGKVRSMFNHLGNKEKKALPSTPVEITGLHELPKTGDTFVVVSSEKKAREIIKYRLELHAQTNENIIHDTLDIINSDNNKIEELSVVLKCDVMGSLEAMSHVIDQLSKKSIKFNILYKGVGSVTESDILLAEASHAIILAFNLKVETKIRHLAQQKGIILYTDNIIYKLIDNIRAFLTTILKPIIREVRIGSACVRQIFNMSKSGNIIGCYVSDGVIKKDAIIKVKRNSQLLHNGRLKALRRFKDDVKEVGLNFECGVLLDSNIDVRVGDIIEAFQLIEEVREL
ncbi:translation initiation factor IF-2 [Wolbachia endosymbiont of Howardula sp.]|uniref:translation initiation factor IF-2 n=1 Tax=Wolbachia endosymbiont of Howardula sp. TaxID=2916816 RepID=UPI00217D72F3|nr:translation initiation factor IF-2 [Wolbachia endosymbiont of Howardula sp.]UWI82961.1 translation initiation factor IF-2 [Wolbachia endosymbiont of Howardula sp.]